MIFKFSIVIPTYKENENLIKLIPLIYKILDTNRYNFELIILLHLYHLLLHLINNTSIKTNKIK